MQRILFTIFVLLALLAGGVSAQDTKEQLSVEEVQKLVLQLQEQLKQQQDLLDAQSKTIQDQTEAIKSLKTQLDQLTMDKTGQAPELSKEELALRERLPKWRTNWRSLQRRLKTF